MGDWTFLTPEPMLYHMGAPGFALFGMGHLASLVASLALVLVSIIVYLRLPGHTDDGPTGARLALLRTLSGTAVGIVFAKCASYLALGILEPLFWPLHICNLCEFAALGYALSPRSAVGRRLADLLFCWGLSGCPGALLFPGWNSYCPAWSLASLCGFAEHALVLACALSVLLGGDYVPDPRRVWFVLLTSVGCGLAFRALNPLLGTNFFFVTNPVAAGGPFPWLVATFGDPAFMLPYLALSVCLWALPYGIYRLAARGRYATR